MDLSYRMQLNGWQCHYLAGLVAPAELPSDLNGSKNQQFRWAKGSTQTAIKLMPQILRSSATPFMKFQAFMHMTHYRIHPLMLILALSAHESENIAATLLTDRNLEKIIFIQFFRLPKRIAKITYR